MEERRAQHVPLYHLVAEANQEFSIVQVILGKLADAGSPEAGFVAGYLLQLVGSSIRLSGHDAAWLRAERDAAQARIREIQSRVEARAKEVGQ